MVFRVNKYFIIFIVMAGLAAGITVGLTGDESHHQFLTKSRVCVFTTITDPNTISIYVCYSVMATWQGTVGFISTYVLLCRVYTWRF